MQNELLKPLKVYSASAGSGKTFSLVQNYLKLTLSDHVSPKNFSKILAMTFTNKAAWEMKERVIQALDWLGYPNRETERESKKAQMLLDATLKTTGLSATKIVNRSKQVLSEILHDYEDFNVLTIDKFSLRLIRTFSRDLDLQEDFEVTLDQDLLLEQVIDELMSKIGQEHEKEVTKLSLNYAKTNADKGDKWDFRRSLIDFSKVLIREQDQKFIHELLKEDFNEEKFKQINEEIQSYQEQHRKLCADAYQYFNSLGTTVDDYPGKSRGIYPHLVKLPSRNITEVKPISSAIEKTLSGENVKKNHNVDPHLMELMQQLFTYESSVSSRMYTLLKIKSNFYNLALLKYISKELTEFKEKKNIIGIFEFGQRIADLLKKENAPYIYERLGNRYNHYLLDEFQDTSRLQWLNLIPLVHESIANNHENLIVGDPKQAIYRFRNGLVEQFVELPEIYNPENDPEFVHLSSYFKQLGEKIPLEDNYRSKRNIVEFNNTFFKRMLDLLPSHFEEYYSDIRQNPKGSDGGFVAIDFCDSKDKEEIKEQEQAFLLQNVANSIADGFDPGDICILTRNKKEGQHYAKTLLEAGLGYKVVSSDSLLVSSDSAVGFCIDYLNLRRNGGNKTTQIKFATSFYRQQAKDPIVELANFWENDKVGSFNFSGFVAQEFNSMNELFFAYENLYDLGASFLQLIGLSELKNPYLHHLLELFQNYDLSQGPDIRGFIEEWNAKLYKSTIQMPENKDAVKIMTIHKSKGLEFPVVIIPRLIWDIKPHRNQSFVEAENDVLLYSNLSKNDVPDYMYAAYKLEYDQLLLDELNTMYVAFTRPSERLYLFVESKSSTAKDGFYTRINQPLFLSLEGWNDDTVSEHNESRMTFGSPEKINKQEEGAEDESNFNPKDLSDFLWFPELSLQDQEALDTEHFNEEQQFGNELHLLLSEVKNTADIEIIAGKLQFEGKIEDKWKAEFISIAKETYALLNTQEFAKNAAQTLDEQDILINEKEVKRPDKIYLLGNKAVVVDFKTGEPLKKHKNQVAAYCTQLYDMGFEETEGYLLYTKNQSLEQVVQRKLNIAEGSNLHIICRK
ncbi:UvrD-helicase domain-containing protein [Brumimicrobium aurantiacum]|uniref:DNA 3'-5' helicase n=1 Tax=Brumimicrobium aurantiacum TaxID=1737063 RepID=A0A3E1F0X9_9FLAO|nr:UvrD-helicase domain-containing protein [Brumimicrobium aurantiacum]RFC55481.1 Dna2/Cas4 domain-containing protein [Brumimicrobium aurantiacum]